MDKENSIFLFLFRTLKIEMNFVFVFVFSRFIFQAKLDITNNRQTGLRDLLWLNPFSGDSNHFKNFPIFFLIEKNRFKILDCSSNFERRKPADRLIYAYFRWFNNLVMLKL